METCRREFLQKMSGVAALAASASILGQMEVTTIQQMVSVFSFVIENRQPLDVVTNLDAQGIAIRGGDLASLPVLKRMGVSAAIRASCYAYTTNEEIDRLVSAL
jgi:selenocysteine lyase/cysteine desulfurase